MQPSYYSVFHFDSEYSFSEIEERAVTVSPFTGKPTDHENDTPFPRGIHPISREEFSINIRMDYEKKYMSSYNWIKIKLFSKVIETVLLINVKIVENYFSPPYDNLRQEKDYNPNTFFMFEEVNNILNIVEFLNDEKCHTLLDHLASLGRSFIAANDNPMVKVVNGILIEESLKKENEIKALKAYDYLKNGISFEVEDSFLSRRDHEQKIRADNERKYNFVYAAFRREIWKEAYVYHKYPPIEVSDDLLDEAIRKSGFLGNGNAHRLLSKMAKDFIFLKQEEILKSIDHKKKSLLFDQALSDSNQQRMRDVKIILSWEMKNESSAFSLTPLPLN